ncbi:MAG: hypothetical protein JJU45_14725 [Acidimicrobiia bacterium]|nr:hypothetical protein [Acidimicrobiia bacterium]
MARSERRRPWRLFSTVVLGGTATALALYRRARLRAAAAAFSERYDRPPTG